MRLIKSENILWCEDVKYYRQRFVKIVVASIAFRLDQSETLIHEREFHALWERVASGIALDNLYPKALSEVLVLGSFVAPNEPWVGIKVGQIDKTLQVFPARFWYPAARFNEFRAFAPRNSLQDTPIDWAHAYGGEGYEFNPQGQGFVRSKAQLYDEQTRVPLPRVEDPRYLLNHPFPARGEVFPGTLAPLSLMHPLRWRYVNRKSWARAYPKIPEDIDSLYFQQALPDQCQQGAFTPGMDFRITGMSPTGLLQGTLPNLKVRMLVQQQSQHLRELDTCLDTLWFLPNENVGVMSFRAQIEVSDWNANDIDVLMLALDQAQSMRDFGFYQEAFEKLQGPNAHVYRAANYGLEISTSDENEVVATVQKSLAMRQQFDRKVKVLSARQRKTLQVLPSAQEQDFLKNNNLIKDKQLAHYDLRGMDFRGKTFERVNFSGANLTQADFTEARLCDVNFLGANLNGARFCQAQLENVRFVDQVLERVDFRFAKMRECVFNQCVLLQSRFAHAFLEATQFFKGAWSEIDALNLVLKKCIFSESAFAQTDLRYGQFQSSNFYQSQFKQVDFSFSHSQRCGFLGLKTLFDDCSFKQGSWSDANFLEASFSRCDFVKMQFLRSEWMATQLREIHFDHCDLKENGFCDARLFDVRFDACELGGCLWQGSRLNGVIFNECDGVDVFMAQVVGS